MEMGCEGWHEAISAYLDGEDPGGALPALEQHLSGCSSCRAFAGAVTDLNRVVRVAPAAQIPDRTVDLVRVMTAQRPPGWRRWLLLGARVGLVAVALVQLALALWVLVFGEGHVPLHIAREMGAFDLALSVGLLVAAWQPRRAFGLLPMAGALAAALWAGSAWDLLSGHTTTGAESVHVLPLVGLLLLWPLAHRNGRGTAA